MEKAKVINKVVFIGSKKQGLSILKSIYKISPESLVAIITFNDVNDIRSMLSEYVQYAKDIGVKIYIAENQKHSEELIPKLNPDICFVVGWYWLFSKKLIEKVKYGLVGVHNSLLPHYRGGAPAVWAMINGEDVIGTSLFSFSDGMDNGPIWAQETIQVNDKDNISDVLKKLEQISIDMVNSNYMAILEGELQPSLQNHDDATYCSQRYPEHGEIDWKQSAKNIFNFIRAQSKPYPGAYTFYSSQKITIQSASLYQSPYYGSAGQIVRVNSSGVLVVCGDSRAILVKEIEISGESKPVLEIFTSIKIQLKSRAE